MGWPAGAQAELHGESLATPAADGVRFRRGAGAPRRGRVADRRFAARWPAHGRSLAAATGSNADALYRVLRFLAGEGVFEERSPGLFANTELSAALRAEAPASPRDFIRMINREPYAAWGQLLHTVRTGETAFDHVFGAPRFEWLADHPEQAALFQQAMVSLSQGGNIEAARAYDFSACRLVVDVGGGHGQLLSAIVTSNPHLSGVLLDLRAGVEAAKKRRRRAAAALRAGGRRLLHQRPGGRHLRHQEGHPRLERRSGDADTRQLPPTRCAAAGRVLVIETIVPPGNDPDPIKLMDLNMLAVTGGMERTRAQYERLFTTADLRLARVLPTERDLSILEARSSVKEGAAACLRTSAASARKGTST